MNALIIINAVIGFFLIGIGFLLVKAPELFAGYNTMPKEERRNVDIHGYAQFMRKVCCIMGVILILGPSLFKLIGLSKWNEVLMLVTLFGGCGIMLNKGRKYEQGVSAAYKKKSLMQTIITSGILIAIAIFTFYSLYQMSIPVSVTVQEDQLVVQGGVAIPVETITSVELRDQLPPIIMRSNGSSFMGHCKGRFQLKELGTCLLYLQPNGGPYLIVFSKRQPPMIINRSTAEETQQLYDQLQPQTME